LTLTSRLCVNDRFRRDAVVIDDEVRIQPAGGLLTAERKTPPPSWRLLCRHDLRDERVGSHGCAAELQKMTAG